MHTRQAPPSVPSLVSPGRRSFSEPRRTPAPRRRPIAVAAGAAGVAIASCRKAGAPPPLPRLRPYRVGLPRSWLAPSPFLPIGADATSPRTAILLVALLTAASGLIVTGTSWRPQRTLDPLPIPWTRRTARR